VLRRRFLLAPLALYAGAQREEIYEMFTRMASALAAGNAIGFLAAFDSRMPEYETLRGYVSALAEQFDVLSSIDLLSLEGDRAELDWFLQLSRKGEAGRVERRRERVRCRLARHRKQWRIEALEPIALFRPPAAGA